MRFHERVIGCFKGLATGDAIGKQTEMLSRADVRRWYPEGITGFHGKPGDVIPRYAGKRYEWRIGETTDDTEQTLAVARALIREGRATHQAIGKELLKCKKSLHPGVALWDFVQASDPARIAPDGDGCGAAMRAAPVGVIYRVNRLDELVRGAYECAIPTHGGPLAICAAAAVAGAVSAALDGRAVDEVLTAALEASTTAESLCRDGSGLPMAASIRRIYADLAERKELVAGELAEEYSLPAGGDSEGRGKRLDMSVETAGRSACATTAGIIVPLAISLALITQSAQQTALLAANIGGDSDSVASIGGAIAGALNPQTVNQEWFEVVNRINSDDLVVMASALATLRLDL